MGGCNGSIHANRTFEGSVIQYISNDAGECCSRSASAGANEFRLVAVGRYDVGLDAAHPAGFRNFLKRAIFDKKNFRSVNLLNGNAEDPFEEAMRYERILRDNPLDVCLCGVGENGHIAFNDPPVAIFMTPGSLKS